MFRSAFTLADADLFITPHGAQLANLIWMPEGAGVVETHCGEEKTWFKLSRLHENVGVNMRWLNLRTCRPSGQAIAVDESDIANIVNNAVELAERILESQPRA